PSKVRSQSSSFVHSNLPLMRNFRLTGLVCLVVLLVAPVSPSQETTEITPGQPIERELKGGQKHTFRIHINAGQFFYTLVDQKGIDVVVTLFDHRNQPVFKVDSPNLNHGPEPLLAIIQDTGEYSIEVSAPNKNAAAARYEITIAALREPTPEDKDHIAADRAFWEANKLRLQRTAVSSRAAIEKYQEA